jgi:phosphotransferase system  glucose/maltose/N-acetylglucosamine-specific IIC component
MTTNPTPESELATARRVPRYGVFMALGALLGAIGAFVLTMVGYAGPTVTGVTYSFGQVLGFAMLYLVPIGIAFGAVVAMLLERIARRKDRVVHVQHERIQVVSEHPDAPEQ